MVCSSELRSQLARLLAIWMAVVAVGVSVTHSHVGGGQPHHHGVGWFAASPMRMPLGDPVASRIPHRHLILLGVELAGESLDGISVYATAPEIGTVLIDTSPVGGEGVLPIESDPLPVPSTTRNSVTATSGVEVSVSGTPSIHLCDYALRAVTGVLRS